MFFLNGVDAVSEVKIFTYLNSYTLEMVLESC